MPDRPDQPERAQGEAPASKGEPFGYITFTILGVVSATLLAGALSLAEELESILAPAMVYAAQAAIAFLLWLPIAYRAMRKQALGLAQAGGLPATIQPARTAWIATLATIPIVALLHFGTDGEWMNRRDNRSGFTLLFWACFPFLTWIAVRSSLGGKPIPNLAAVPEPKPAEPPMYAARELAGAPYPEGAARDRIKELLAVFDGVDDRFAAAFGREMNAGAVQELARSLDEVKLAIETAWATPLLDDVPLRIKFNLAMGGEAYCDAIRIAATDADTVGRIESEAIASKYRELGLVAADDMGLVVAIARRARDNAAVEIGMGRREWPALRTREGNEVG
jgi:hypothetical protein